MARSKTEIIDDDGNVIAPPAPESAIAQIVWLMEYGRKRGFRIGPTIQVGDTTVQVLDMHQEAQTSRQGEHRAPDLTPGSDMATILGGGEGDE